MASSLRLPRQRKPGRRLGLAPDLPACSAIVFVDGIKLLTYCFVRPAVDVDVICRVCGIYEVALCMEHLRYVVEHLTGTTLPCLVDADGLHEVVAVDSVVTRL